VVCAAVGDRGDVVDDVSGPAAIRGSVVFRGAGRTAGGRQWFPDGRRSIWLTMALGFAIAFPFAFLADRWLLARGKGHALVHQYRQH
jgi:hypothetical protein